MKNNLVALILSMLSVLVANNIANCQSFIKYENSYKVATKLRTTANVSESDFSQNLVLWEIKPPKGNKFVKFIADTKNFTYFGYSLEFIPTTDDSKIKILIKPVKESGYSFDGIHVPTDENDNYSLAYGEFVVPLVKAVQELNEKTETQNNLLRKQIEEMHQEIEVLKEALKKGK